MWRQTTNAYWWKSQTWKSAESSPSSWSEDYPKSGKRIGHARMKRTFDTKMTGLKSPQLFTTFTLNSPAETANEASTSSRKRISATARVASRTPSSRLTRKNMMRWTCTSLPFSLGRRVSCLETCFLTPALRSTGTNKDSRLTARSRQAAISCRTLSLGTPDIQEPCRTTPSCSHMSATFRWTSSSSCKNPLRSRAKLFPSPVSPADT